MLGLEVAPFGSVEGRPVDRWVLRAGDLEAAVLTYGGTIQALHVPDRYGSPADVVLGFPTLEGYLGDQPYLGATIGRYANRITRGRFSLDGREYQLPVNRAPNCLHGGTTGFDRRIWDAEPVESADSVGVRLGLVSPDGDNGFPGTLTVTVTMTLSTTGLRLDYEATTDAPTVLNLTNHSYFNLAGAGTVEGHVLEIAAARFTLAGPDEVPTGELAPVEGTPFDFRSPTAIGARIRQGHPQVVQAQGYDHNYVLDRTAGDPLSFAARVLDPASGRELEVWTDQPGVQLYTSNFLDGTLVGKGEQVYRQTDALCLETQHFPDSVNQPEFPSTVLRPGERFASTTELRITS